MTTQDRLEANSIPIVWSGCWLWLGQSWKGYGRISHTGTTKLTHRVAFELARGPIPHGFEINHLCREKACINPAHLEAVEHGENIRYDFQLKPWGNQNTAKTHCIRGHALSGSNLYLRKGKRYCRECRSIYDHIRRQK
jgi:hypothetical protein